MSDAPSFEYTLVRSLARRAARLPLEASVIEEFERELKRLDRLVVEADGYFRGHRAASASVLRAQIRTDAGRLAARIWEYEAALAVA